MKRSEGTVQSGSSGRALPASGTLSPSAQLPRSNQSSRNLSEGSARSSGRAQGKKRAMIKSPSDSPPRRSEPSRTDIAVFQPTEEHIAAVFFHQQGSLYDADEPSDRGEIYFNPNQRQATPTRFSPPRSVRGSRENHPYQTSNPRDTAGLQMNTASREYSTQLPTQSTQFIGTSPARQPLA